MVTQPIPDVQAWVRTPVCRILAPPPAAAPKWADWGSNRRPHDRRSAALPLGHYLDSSEGPPCCLGPYLLLTKNPSCVHLSDCLLAGSGTDWLTVNLSSRCTAEGNRISSPSLVRAEPHKHPTRQQDSASSQLRQSHKHVWQCRRHVHAHGLLTYATHTSALHASHASVYASQGTRAVPLGIFGQGMWTGCPYPSHAVSMDCRPAPGAQECSGGSEIAVPEGTTKCIRLYASGQPHWTHDPLSGCAPQAAQHAHTWSMHAPRTYQLRRPPLNDGDPTRHAPLPPPPRSHAR